MLNRLYALIAWIIVGVGLLHMLTTNLNLSSLDAKTVTNRWPAYAQVSHDSNLCTRHDARPRQRWLILFSLGLHARTLLPRSILLQRPIPYRLSR